MVARVYIQISEPKRFYSNLDEQFFFQWLSEIDAVVEVLRVGAKLRLAVSQPIDDVSFRDLISLLARYGVEMRALTVLANQDNKSWLENPQAYWHQAMFS